jgi:hypothetical protein
LTFLISLKNRGTNFNEAKLTLKDILEDWIDFVVGGKGQRFSNETDMDLKHFTCLR